ncbi:hypothetical protein [Bradyrhizobium sp. USDA 4454]
MNAILTSAGWGTAMIVPKGPLFIINISNPDAFSGKGSIIMLELADEDAAVRVAQKIAAETGRRVIVRKEDLQVIETIAPPTTH